MEKRKSNPVYKGLLFGALPGLIIGLLWTIMASGESGLASMGITCFLSTVITVLGAGVGAVVGYLVSRSGRRDDEGQNDIDDILPPDMR